MELKLIFLNIFMKKLETLREYLELSLCFEVFLATGL
jgi:hypothetical protein